MATQFRLKQELKYIYVKNQKLNERLYKIRLQCANKWQKNWTFIQANIDEKLQYYMETRDNNLNKKTDELEQSILT